MVTWALCVVALSVFTTFVTSRLHYFVSAVAALAIIASVEIASLRSYSKHGGDASNYFLRNLDILAIAIVVSLLIAAAMTFLILRWRRR